LNELAHGSNGEGEEDLGLSMTFSRLSIETSHHINNHTSEE